MTRGAILAADGFDESHLIYARHRLREDGTIVEIATPDREPAVGDRGTTVTDTLGATYGAAPPGPDGDRTLDFVILPSVEDADGKLPSEVVRWLSTQVRGGAVLGCLGASVALLDEIDGFSDRLVTGPAELASAVEAAGGQFTGERVTVDGNVVTGRDTDALPFFMVAVRNTLAIPQDPDTQVRTRPYQERAFWGSTES